MARILLAATAFSMPLFCGAQTAGVVLAEGCRMADEDRVDSWDHVFALTPSECEHRGFCWARHDVPGVPWCYWKAGEGHVDPSECEAASSSRRECAEKGISINEKTCTAKACCWAAGPQGQPWCFHPGAPGSTPKPKEKKAVIAEPEIPQLPQPTPLLFSPKIRPTPPPPGWRPDVHTHTKQNEDL